MGRKQGTSTPGEGVLLSLLKVFGPDVNLRLSVSARWKIVSVMTCCRWCPALYIYIFLLALERAPGCDSALFLRNTQRSASRLTPPTPDRRFWSSIACCFGRRSPVVFERQVEESPPPPKGERYVPPVAGGLGLGRDRAPPGPQSWSSGGDSGGRPEPRGYPQQRAPSGRTHYGQDGRGYALPSGRDGDGSPFRDEGASGGGMHGHRLRESDFPLEMGGTPKTEKPTQLRPRGEECWCRLVDACWIFGTVLALL